MYNINFTKTSESASPQEVKVFLNLSSYVDPKILSGGGTSGNYIILKFRGRNTNYQRTIIAKPASGLFTGNPQYTHTNRAWLIKFDVLYAKALFIPGGVANSDILAQKLIGRIVLPCDDIYDVSLFYNSDLQLNTHLPGGGKYATPINIGFVLNANQSAKGVASLTNPDTTQPISFYTSYNDNDLDSENMSAFGKPDSEAVENKNVEYGVQNWTTTYNN